MMQAEKDLLDTRTNGPGPSQKPRQGHLRPVQAFVIYDEAVSVEAHAFVPGTRDRLLNRFINLAMRHALVKQLANGAWFSELGNVPNVWGEGASAEEAIMDLADGLRDWLELKISDRDGDIPVIDGVDVNAL